MEDQLISSTSEPYDGDWCLVDLSEPITEEATMAAHALGVDFHTFMCSALEEKLARLRDEREDGEPLREVSWRPLLGCPG